MITAIQSIAPDRAGIAIAMVACEESGDRLGAALMHALVAKSDKPIKFSGVGGPGMEREGLWSLFPIGELAIVGIDAVIAKLPMILRRIRETADAVIAANPHVLVIIDSPDFTHRVARKVRAAAPHIRIVDYVSPSVWAWRPGRARAMRAYVDHVLALLPFEPATHERLGGPPCTYVGHPVVEIANRLRPDEAARARREADPPLILVLPGSRGGEVRRMLPLFAKAVALAAERAGPFELVLPTVPHLLPRIAEGTKSWPVPPRIVVDQEEKWAAFRSARAALAASGTVTLELAVAGVPTVVSYKISLLEELVGHLLVRVPTIVLANLVLGENVMPEIVQRAATPERLAQALVAVIGPSQKRDWQLGGFARIDEVMGIDQKSPATAAAEVVLACCSATKSC
ncbi:MAG: lipid-A-disaccharide synthase [Xanthobacteraceae bacterium]